MNRTAKGSCTPISGASRTIRSLRPSLLSHATAQVVWCGCLFDGFLRRIEKILLLVGQFPPLRGHTRNRRFLDDAIEISLVGCPCALVQCSVLRLCSDGADGDCDGLGPDYR